MKPRARLVLPVLAASLSTVAIIVRAETAVRHPDAAEIATLLKFENRFNEVMAELIRKQGQKAPENSYFLHRAMQDMLLDRAIQLQLSMKMPKDAKAPAPQIVELKSADQKKLRDLVIKRLDTFYRDGFPPDQLQDILKAGASQYADFYVERFYKAGTSAR